MSRLLLLVAPCLVSSCLSATWNRSRDLEQLASPALDNLEIGHADLGDCLAALGAPTRVWEVDRGTALAWHWVDRNNWGLSFSVPIGNAANANLSYGNIASDAQGAVLFFDDEWQLIGLRRGQIAELLAEARRRPTLMD